MIKKPAVDMIWQVFLHFMTISRFTIESFFAYIILISTIQKGAG